MMQNFCNRLFIVLTLLFVNANAMASAKTISFPSQSKSSQAQLTADESLRLHQETGTFLDTIVIGALDKVTARTSRVTLKLGEPKKIGTLIVRAMRAWKSNPEEPQEAKVFFDVVEQLPQDTNTQDLRPHTDSNDYSQKDQPDEKSSETQEVKPIFRGWLFKSHRGIASINHPVYDIWIIDVEGEPHDGIFDLQEVAPKDLDEATKVEIRELIDQLMEDDTSEPIEIEPDEIKDIAPQDIPSEDHAEALAIEPEEPEALNRPEQEIQDFQINRQGGEKPQDLSPVY